MASNLRVDTILPSTGTSLGIGTVSGTTTVTGTLNAASATITGNLGIGGTLTYEDVTNIDSIGIITARSTVSIADSIVHTGDTNTSLRFPAADTITAETGGSERVRITSAGKVGINEASPDEHLHITNGSGNIFYKVEASNIAGLKLVGGAGVNHIICDDTLAFFTNSAPSAGSGGASSEERLRITSDGKVLIKTLTDVFGGTDFGVKGQISIANDNAYRRAYLSGSNNHLYFWNGSNQGYLSSSGNWVDSSDQSLKKDITDLTYGIDALKNLKPRKYKMKSDNKEQIGFIAQEVESVIPEVVDAGETPDGTEQKGLSYGNLTAVLTKALQEAIAKIEKLEAEVAALKGS